MTVNVPSFRRRRAASPLTVVVGAALLMAVTASQAQYKVIGADGKVTYTDRAPTTPEGKVSDIGGKAPTQGAQQELPFELRQVATKYPVTLYTVAGACEPCASARQLLKQRGIPYAERQVVTDEDSEALEKLSGGREAPTLTIGSQILRGLANDVWVSYLDAAGYPRESRLPASYQYRPASPVVDRREPAPTPTQTAGSGLPLASDRPAAAQTPATATPGGIRF